jgi:chromosomal replication initiator protein
MDAWDGYLIGPENALAHAGALALARGDAAGVSPLVVCGPAGVGKSRLLAGLVAERLARHPGAAVAHLTAEAFAAACAEAASRPDGWAELRARFRALDLFVLEDVHALERAPLALAELAPTLDALADAGAAVAVSAREGPAQWRGW